MEGSTDMVNGHRWYGMESRTEHETAESINPYFSAAAAYQNYSAISQGILGKPQGSYFFRGPTTKRGGWGVRARPLRKKELFL